ncbi:unnamed protein product [Mytilus edulis]|uniref:NIDO domain-containing protein n=1 Tax=Mytilus edulis TaxID=6550 RepID=A0A8S3Q8H4_MYTED|nr:unnamed protein product [Mytilus edulis]
MQFLAKTQTLNRPWEPLFIPSFNSYATDSEDLKLCPCRALRIYINRTKSIRKSNRLFVTYKKNHHKEALKDSIARWIVNTVRYAYENADKDTLKTVGFDAGDGIHFYSVTGSQTPGIINITQMSNIGIPGKFIFGVDQATIEQVTSAQTSTLALLSGRQTTEDTATEQIAGEQGFNYLLLCCKRERGLLPTMTEAEYSEEKLVVHSEHSTSKLLLKQYKMNENGERFFTLHALSNVTGNNIRVVYPPVNGTGDLAFIILNTTCLPSNETDKTFTVMWTSCSSPDHTITWSANHFVPLIRKPSMYQTYQTTIDLDNTEIMEQSVTMKTSSPIRARTYMHDDYMAENTSDEFSEISDLDNTEQSSITVPNGRENNGKFLSTDELMLVLSNDAKNKELHIPVELITTLDIWLTIQLTNRRKSKGKVDNM